MKRRLVLLDCGPMIRFALGVVAVAASCTAARGEMGLFAKYDWINGAQDVSGSRLRHDGVLDPGITVSDGKVHLEGWDGVDLGYMPELDGAHEVLLRFEDVTLEAGGLRTVVAGGGGRPYWSVGWYTDAYDDDEPTYLFFEVGALFPASTGWHLNVPALTGAESVRLDSTDFRFTAAAPEGEQLAIRWNDGDWVTGGWGEGTITEFPSPLPARLNDGNRADWDPVRTDLAPVSFYSDRASVPEPAAVVLLMFGAVMCILWGCRGAYRRHARSRF